MRHRKVGVGCNPSVGGGTHKFSLAHGHWCATESRNSVAHALNMRHRKGRNSVAHLPQCATESTEYPSTYS